MTGGSKRLVEFQLIYISLLQTKMIGYVSSCKSKGLVLGKLSLLEFRIALKSCCKSGSSFAKFPCIPIVPSRSAEKEGGAVSKVVTRGPSSSEI